MQKAFAFFEQAAIHGEIGVGRIAKEWIADAGAACPWLKAPASGGAGEGVRLVHSYESGLWSEVSQQLAQDEPSEFFIVSPFHDEDNAMCSRLSGAWPAAKIEMLVQSQVTRLAVPVLKRLKTVRLSALTNESRRVHAKLLAWRGRHGSGCIVGSANFTCAAFDGRNVEACLFVGDSAGRVDELFDARLSKRGLAFDEFEPGVQGEPDSDDSKEPPLHLRSIVMGRATHLSMSYVNDLPATALRLSIRAPGESLPRVSVGVPRKPHAVEDVTVPERAWAELHGTLLATLVAEVDGSRIESAPVWIVQEERLTYEPSGAASSSKRRIEESGEGLPAFLEELGARDGVAAVIEFLAHLSIRFSDGSGGAVGGRSFRVKIRDPFRPDTAPAWLIDVKGEHSELEDAILDFVDRHVDGRLQKHAKKGNVNGMANFVDIFTTLVELLIRYQQHGVVKTPRAVKRLCTMIEVATVGSDIEDESFGGYLQAVYENLGRDLRTFQKGCAENQYGAEVRAALLIAQYLRFDPKETAAGGQPSRMRDVLPTLARAVSRGLSDCEPAVEEVRQALTAYGILPNDEVVSLLAELP